MWGTGKSLFLLFAIYHVIFNGLKIILPPTYLAKCYDYVRSGGGVCIADEVQTGFGRCGEHFWMFQLHDVVHALFSI